MSAGVFDLQGRMLAQANVDDLSALPCHYTIERPLSNQINGMNAEHRSHQPISSVRHFTTLNMAQNRHANFCIRQCGQSLEQGDDSADLVRAFLPVVGVRPHTDFFCPKGALVSWPTMPST